MNKGFTPIQIRTLVKSTYFTEHYMFSPKYLDYPVLGLTWNQSMDFLNWLSDRYNEYLLIRKGYQDFYWHQCCKNSFNTESHLFDQYEGMINRAIWDQETNKIFANLNQLLQTEQGERFFESIVAYLLYATSIDTQKYLEKMKTVSQKAEKRFVSTAMKLETRGIEKGIKKVAFSMITKNYSNQEIVELTGLNEKQLEYLRTLKDYQLELEIA